MTTPAITTTTNLSSTTTPITYTYLYPSHHPNIQTQQTIRSLDVDHLYTTLLDPIIPLSYIVSYPYSPTDATLFSKDTPHKTYTTPTTTTKHTTRHTHTHGISSLSISVSSDRQRVILSQSVSSHVSFDLQPLPRRCRGRDLTSFL